MDSVAEDLHFSFHFILIHLNFNGGTCFLDGTGLRLSPCDRSYVSGQKILMCLAGVPLRYACDSTLSYSIFPIVNMPVILKLYSFQNPFYSLK